MELYAMRKNKAREEDREWQVGAVSRWGRKSGRRVAASQQNGSSRASTVASWQQTVLFCKIECLSMCHLHQSLWILRQVTGELSYNEMKGSALSIQRSGRMGTAALGTPLRRRGLAHKQRAWPSPGTQRWSCSPAGRQRLGAEMQGVGGSGSEGSL